MNLSYITDFHGSRSDRIGSSDIAAMLPHPDRPNESLAGYGRTAITVYEEKAGLRPRTPAGFSAEMGHYIEPKTIREFIRDMLAGVESMNGEGIARSFYRGYMLYELEAEVREPYAGFTPIQYNNTSFKHHTEAVTSFGVAHADCVYVPEGGAQKVKTSHGFTVDFTRPFIVEAKSAQYWAARRRNDKYAGYDLSLKEWQGIPLRHYIQIQYQMALYNLAHGHRPEDRIDTAYLALIFNTSEKHYWQIKANKKHQAELVELAEKMKWCIDKKKPPKELAMNADDIRKLYPEIKEDFCEISGEALDKAVEIAKAYRNADANEKAWKLKKEDALDAMSVLLKDNREITGRVGDKVQTIARWKPTGGGEAVKALSKIKAENEDVYKYLLKKGMIEERAKSERPDIKLKIEEVGE